MATSTSGHLINNSQALVATHECVGPLVRLANGIIERASRRNDCRCDRLLGQLRCLAFLLMGNHVHLVVQVDEIRLD